MAKAALHKLNLNQLEFLKQYLLTLNTHSGRANASLAYHKVYGGERGPANQVKASQLLLNPIIQAEIEAFKHRARTEFNLTKEEVLAEFHKLATFDIRDIYNEETNTLLPIADFPASAGAAVAGVEVEEIFEMIDGEKVSIGNTVKVKLHNKIGALKGLVDIKGYNAPTKVASTDVNGKDRPQPLTDIQVDSIIKALQHGQHESNS